MDGTRQNLRRAFATGMRAVHLATHEIALANAIQLAAILMAFAFFIAALSGCSSEAMLTGSDTRFASEREK